MNVNKDNGSETIVSDASEDSSSVGSETAQENTGTAGQPQEDLFTTTSTVAIEAGVEAKVIVGRFNVSLEVYRKATKEGMQAARECSELALLHFQQHGDVSLIERFEATMPKNYARRAAFLKWCKQFSPLAKIEGKLCKDKSEKAKAFNLEGAFKTPFWDAHPDTEQVAWDMTKVVDMLTKTVNKFMNGSGFTDPSPEQMADLAVVREHISLLPQVIKQARNKVDGKAAA